MSESPILDAVDEVPVELLRINIERSAPGVPSYMVDQILAEVKDSLYVALVAQAAYKAATS